MHLLRVPLILLAALVLFACGDDEEADQDPCRGVTCPEGYDCFGGRCIERQEPEPQPAGCQSHVDCFQDPAGAYCDRSTGACVGCLDDGHCNGRQCVGGACVGTRCNDDSDCAAPTPFCTDAGDACVVCRAAEHCATGETCDRGSCVALPVECASDEDCADAPGRPRCAMEGGRGLCVECASEADCGAGEECRGGSCVDLRCEGNADCAAFPDLSVCVEGSCVECGEDGDCGAGELCIDRQCEEPTRCRSDADCSDDRVCDPLSGACVVCLDDDDCPLGQTCRSRLSCIPIGCGTAADCPAGARCDGGQCVDPGPCSGDADCAFDPRVPVCAGDGACVECTADAHCDAGQRCIDRTCAQPQDCAVDSDCGGGYVCSGGLCAACRLDEQCPRGRCEAGACVDAPTCSTDADCAVGVCTGGRCAACATDLDCAAGLWCDAGACVPPWACASDRECGAGFSCVAGACTATGCPGDEEPDQSPARARPFVPGTALSGTLCTNDEDWYVFSAPAGAGLTAQLVTPLPGGTLTLAWYEPQDRALRTLQGTASLVVPSLPAAAVGRYYLRVHSSEGASGSYGLVATIQIAGGACTDVMEPNDTRQAPRPISMERWYEGLWLCGDDDFFLVELPAGRTLLAYLFSEGRAGAVELFTPAGDRLGGAPVATSFLGGGWVVSAPADPQPRQVLVKVSGRPASPARYSLFVTSPDDPGCDVAPVLLDGNDRARIVASTLGAAADQGTGACGGGGPDRVWRVHLDDASRFLAQVRAPFNARLSLRDDTCSGELACSVALASGVGILDVPSLPAGDYSLVVGGAVLGAGPFELAARLLPPLAAPPNDACDGATELLFNGVTAVEIGSTEGAISDSSLSCGPGAPEVYYAFHLDQPGRVVIELEADGPAALALLGAGCSGERSCLGPRREATLDTQLPAGDYVVAVGSTSGAPVGFQLHVSRPAPVANDACADATPLTLPATVQGDTTWAADDVRFALAGSCTGYFTGGHDVFYEVDLAAGQTITATLTPAADYDAALYVIGACDGAPQCLAGVDGAFAGGQETLQFTAPASGTWRLAVDGASGGGSFTLRVE